MKDMTIHFIRWRRVAVWGITLAACWSCSNELPVDVSPKEGMPVKVMAEIASEESSTKAAAADNDYDRSSFVTGDKIRVTKTYNAVKTVVDYIYSGTGWSASSTPLTLQAGATYQAVYPADNNTAIQPDQSAKENYIKSNRLVTSVVESPQTEELNFTIGNGAPFDHVNAKLTLVFSGSNALSGNASLDVSATGLRTGGASEEHIILYRPSASGYTWCGIVYPGQKDIKIDFSIGSVSYPVQLPQCPLLAGKNYKFTLNLQNNILVPVANEITDWKTETVYTGEFN